MEPCPQRNYPCSSALIHSMPLCLPAKSARMPDPGCSAHRGHAVRLLLPFFLLALLTLLPAPPAANAARPRRGAADVTARLTWSLPEAIGRSSLAGEASSLAAVTCPSSRLCVAADRDGAVLVSRAPLRGVREWRQIPLAGGADLVAVTCPAGSICLAASRDGRLFTSTSPTVGGSWSASAFSGLSALTGLACAERGPCVATDDAGDVATSPSPGAPAGSWQIAHVDGATRSCGSGRCQVALTGITCPGGGLCLAFDDAGQLVRSENPTGGATAWQTLAVDGRGAALTPAGGACEFAMCAAVHCSGGESCVAVDSGGQILTSPEPEGPSTAWSIHSTGARGEPVALACAGTSSCEVADQAGEILSTLKPSGGSGAFQAAQVEPLLADGLPAAALTGLACPSTAECVATDARGRIVVGSPPATRLELRRLLRVAGRVPRRAGGIRTLLGRRGIVLRLDAPQAGLLTVSWYSSATAGGTPLATGSAAMPGPGRVDLKIAPTSYGRRLLRAARRVRVTTAATFTSLSGGETTLRGRYELSR